MCVDRSCFAADSCATELVTAAAALRLRVLVPLTLRTRSRIRQHCLLSLQLVPSRWADYTHAYASTRRSCWLLETEHEKGTPNTTVILLLLNFHCSKLVPLLAYFTLKMSHLPFSCQLAAFHSSLLLSSLLCSTSSCAVPTSVTSIAYITVVHTVHYTSLNSFCFFNLRIQLCEDECVTRIRKRRKFTFIILILFPNIKTELKWTFETWTFLGTIDIEHNLTDELSGSNQFSSLQLCNIEVS